MRGVIRIIQSLIGGSVKFYRDITKILQPKTGPYTLQITFRNSQRGRENSNKTKWSFACTACLLLMSYRYLHFIPSALQQISYNIESSKKKGIKSIDEILISAFPHSERWGYVHVPVLRRLKTNFNTLRLSSHVMKCLSA